MRPPFDLLPQLLDGAVVTLKVSALTGIISFLFSLMGGFASLSGFAPLRWTARFLIGLFRGVPVLIQVFWMYFVLPEFGVDLSSMTVAVLGLSLIIGAYGSEIVRAAIVAVPKGQTEAAIALNMTPWQRMRRIIFPQALVIMLPSFGNLLVEMVKATALVSLVTLSDLTFKALTLRKITFRTVEIFGLVLVMYFIVTYPLSLGIRWIERKVARGVEH